MAKWVREGSTDVAALSAAVIAITVSMLVVSGPYDVSGAMVAVTLLLLLMGFVWDHHRSLVQSAAVASLIGIIATPLVGFSVELLVSHDAWSLLRKGDPVNCFSEQTQKWVSCSGDNKHSSVSNLWQLGTWVIVAVATFAVDRFGHPAVPVRR